MLHFIFGYIYYHPLIGPREFTSNQSRLRVVFSLCQFLFHSFLTHSLPLIRRNCSRLISYCAVCFNPLSKQKLGCLIYYICQWRIQSGGGDLKTPPSSHNRKIKQTFIKHLIQPTLLSIGKRLLNNLVQQHCCLKRSCCCSHTNAEILKERPRLQTDSFAGLTLSLLPTQQEIL